VLIDLIRYVISLLTALLLLYYIYCSYIDYNYVAITIMLYCLLLLNRPSTNFNILRFKINSNRAVERNSSSVVYSRYALI